MTHRHISPLFALCLAVQTIIGSPASAREGTGRAGLKHPLGVEVEAEFYAGKRGYLHGGLGVLLPLNERQKIGVVAHFVREETDAEVFPSLGAEFIQDFGEGYEVEKWSPETLNQIPEWLTGANLDVEISWEDDRPSIR